MTRRSVFKPAKTSPDEKLARLEAAKATILSGLEDLREISFSPDRDEEALSSALAEIEKEVTFLKNSFMLSGVATSSKNAEDDFNAYTKDGRKKLILCVELKRFFTTHAEAHRETGVNTGNLGQALRGINRTAGGYHWMYIDPDIVNSKRR